VLESLLLARVIIMKILRLRIKVIAAIPMTAKAIPKNVQSNLSNRAARFALRREGYR
jgi:hypothetical protein